MKALPLLVLLLQAPAATPDGFRVARPGYRFAFPKDHGAHPEFRTEWWYLTGHLWGKDGHRFGYQLTFFRQASPKAAWSGSAAWRSDQLHLAHAALTDVDGRTFRFEERMNRQGIPADSAEGRLSVFNEAWRLEGRPDGSLDLHLAARGAALDLRLRPLTPPVVFGQDGVSRKGADPTAASHYVTFPRMAAEGRLTLPGGTQAVSGGSWMDHEFSSNQLDPEQVGWDWAGIQFRDGRSWMVYRLRRKDGFQDPWSTLAEVDAAGRVVRSTRDFRMAPLGAWTSPASGAVYPAGVSVEAFGTALRLVPLLADQELRTGRSTGITYWEGACRVTEGEREVGDAYLELTGYAGSLKGRM